MSGMDDRVGQAGPAPLPAAGAAYVIAVRGRIGDCARTAFAPLHVTTTPGRTLLQGVLEDQSALYGVLARIASLGLELEEVRLAGGGAFHDHESLDMP